MKQYIWLSTIGIILIFISVIILFYTPVTSAFEETQRGVKEDSYKFQINRYLDTIYGKGQTDVIVLMSYSDEEISSKKITQSLKSQGDNSVSNEVEKLAVLKLPGFPLKKSQNLRDGNEVFQKDYDTEFVENFSIFPSGRLKFIKISIIIQKSFFEEKGLSVGLIKSKVLQLIPKDMRSIVSIDVVPEILEVRQSLFSSLLHDVFTWVHKRELRTFYFMVAMSLTLVLGVLLTLINGVSLLRGSQKHFSNEKTVEGSIDISNLNLVESIVFDKLDNFCGLVAKELNSV